MNKILGIFVKNYENFWKNFALIIIKLIQFQYNLLKFWVNFKKLFSQFKKHKHKKGKKNGKFFSCVFQVSKVSKILWRGIDTFAIAKREQVKHYIGLILEHDVATDEYSVKFLRKTKILRIVLLLFLCLTFEACSSSIAVRATDLIGIYESDNGRKGK